MGGPAKAAGPLWIIVRFVVKGYLRWIDVGLRLLSSASSTRGSSFSLLDWLGNGDWRGASRIAHYQDPLQAKVWGKIGYGLPAETGVRTFGAVVAKLGFPLVSGRIADAALTVQI